MAAREIAKLVFPVLKGLVVAGLILAWAAHSAKAQNIFWTQYSSIGSASYAGTDVNDLFINLPSPVAPGYLPAQMATDGTYIYWVNQGKGTIGRATLGGGEVNASFITGKAYYGLAVGGGYIFWTEPPNGDGTLAYIGRANLDGSDVNENFITATNNAPLALAVSGDYLYWTNNWESNSLSCPPCDAAIGRAELNGTGVDVGFRPVADGYPLYGIAVNGSYIYWSSAYSNSSRTGSIGRTTLDGRILENNFIITNAGLEPDQIALDPSYIYWANNGAGIGRANLDGTDVNQTFVSDESIGNGVTVVPPAPSCGIGGEVAPLLPLLFWLRSRRRRVAGGISVAPSLAAGIACTAIGLMWILALGAASSEAATLPFTGTLSVTVGDLGTFSVTGSGTGTSVYEGHFFASAAIPANVFQMNHGALLPTSFATELGLGGIAVCAPGIKQGTHLTISSMAPACPSAGQNAALSYTDGGGLGSIGSTLYVTNTAFQSVGEIPLSVIGNNQSATGTVVGAESYTIQGHSWTTNEVTSGTTLVLTAIGFDDRSIKNDEGTLKLVTPALITLGDGETIPIIATMTLDFGPPVASAADMTLHVVPEPGTALLLGSGMAGLVVLGRRRTRKCGVSGD
jgi:hypothetical protein